MNEQEMIRTGFIILGFTGGAIYLGMSIFYSRIVQDMKKDKETAIAKFFLQDRALKAFKILVLSGLALIFTFMIEIYGIAENKPLIATIARTIYPLPMISLAYFSYTLQKVTRSNSSQE